MKTKTVFMMLAVITPLMVVATTTQLTVPGVSAQDENVTMEEATNAFIAQDNETMEEATNALVGNMTTNMTAGNITAGNMTT